MVLFQYTCVVTNYLNVIHKCTEVNSIQGLHTEKMNSENITGIIIDNKKVQYLPTNLGQKLQNLVALRIKYGRLKEIRKSFLKQIPMLKHLNLDNNDIEVLEENLFEFNSELAVIWFDGNKIAIIGETTFKNLNSLHDLDLSGNVCYSERIQALETVNITLIKDACFNTTNKILYEVPAIDCQLLMNLTNMNPLDTQLKNDYEQLSLKINEIEKDLKDKKDLREKVRQKLGLISRFNDHDCYQETSISFLLKYFWTAMVGLPLLFVLFIVNAVLVFKFK